MEKDRSAKVLAIIALFVAVIGLSLGFAAFSQNLDIKPAAQVEPKATTFRVVFSSSKSSVMTSQITPTFDPSDDNAPSGDNATIANPAEGTNESNPTISGINAKFTAPGQTVTYTFYAFNEGEYDAYLRSVKFNGAKTCTPSASLTNHSAGSAESVEAACAGIKVKVTVGSDSDITADKEDFKEHKLLKSAGEEVKVEIKYEEESSVADGDFTVALPTITLNYQSVDDAA